MYNRQATHTATRTLIQEALTSLEGEQHDARMGAFETALAVFLATFGEQAALVHVVTLVQRAATALRAGNEDQGYFQLCAALAPFRMGWLPLQGDESPIAPLFAAFRSTASAGFLKAQDALDLDDRIYSERQEEDEYAGLAGIDPHTGTPWSEMEDLYEGPFAD